MRNLVPVYTGFGGIPNLPELARTRSGVQFDPRVDRWVYRDNASTVSLNFPHLRKTTSDLTLSIKGVLLWYAENMSAAHLKNMFSHLERFFRVVTDARDEPLKEITSRDLINYRATLRKRDSWYLGSLSGLFQKWHELGYPGVPLHDRVDIDQPNQHRIGRPGKAWLHFDL